MFNFKAGPEWLRRRMDDKPQGVENLGYSNNFEEIYLIKVCFCVFNNNCIL